MTQPMAFGLLLLAPAILAQNPSTSCAPSQCTATCQPGCTSEQVCILGTMTNCGQCPASKCVDRNSVGLGGDNGSSNSQGTDNSSLIGGLVGGLLGAGLIAALLGLCIYKYRKNRKRSLPIAFQATTRSMASMQPPPSFGPSVIRDRPMSSSTRASAAPSITSGVIPIAYIPPSHEFESHPVTATPLPPQQPSQLRQSLTQITPENPFADPRHSQYSVDDEDDERSQTNAASIQSVQFTRARAQIVRVNTVRDLQRNNSVRTILTKTDEEPVTRSNSIQTHTTSHRIDSNLIDPAMPALDTVASPSDPTAANPSPSTDAQNPFQDQFYSADEHNDAPPSSRPVTNHSISSTVGDGEITVLWHG
ncbi:hypothetical protein DM01DRAFT_1332274 [Hesseltinella vesiculosa]|uniref:Membrane anchor Opy2 N-terminal domain-containing protein n=1 Tax=Hesseltinella vesiculosa TaxID=101127 RepID=A0A1X2GUJ2_9FUNG|nr:hypothetical protein DM01DRAFT_1332274 [Hesseltinella vesiculosa]